MSDGGARADGYKAAGNTEMNPPMSDSEDVYESRDMEQRVRIKGFQLRLTGVILDYFENDPNSGGCEIDDSQSLLQHEDTCLFFKKPEGAGRVVEKGDHVVPLSGGLVLTALPFSKTSIYYKSPELEHRISIKGFKIRQAGPVLDYFEDFTRSGGGDIDEDASRLTNEGTFLFFKNPSNAARVLQKGNHSVPLTDTSVLVLEALPYSDTSVYQTIDGTLTSSYERVKCQTYVVYADSQVSDRSITNVFGKCLKEVSDGVVTVHRGCSHNCHEGWQMMEGSSFVVKKTPPQALEATVKLTRAWLRHYCDLTASDLTSILDPLAERYGKIGFSDKGYAVPCAVDQIQDVDLFLQSELKKAVLKTPKKVHGSGDDQQGHGSGAINVAGTSCGRTVSHKVPIINRSKSVSSRPKASIIVPTGPKAPLMVYTGPKARKMVPTGPVQWMENDDDSLTFCLRSNVKVIVHQGDFLTDKADVIVTEANTKLTWDKGLAHKIAIAAGPRLTNACKVYVERNGHLAVGDVVDTPAGKLPKPIRGVMHAVCHPLPKTTPTDTVQTVLQSVVFKSLKMANDKWEASTVALPPIGATVFPIETVAVSLLTAVYLFHDHLSSGKRSTHVKEIRIMSPDGTTNDKLIKCLTVGLQDLATSSSALDERHTLSHGTTGEPYIHKDKMMRLMVDDMLQVAIYKSDLVRQRTDAIVSPANSRLQHDAGAAGAITEAAGPTLLQECADYIRRHGEVPVGHAMHTTSGYLVAAGIRVVIHAVGPFWNEQQQQQSYREIRDTFLNSLVLANKLQCGSVSIPAISSGIFRVPLEVVGTAAFDAIIRYCQTQQLPHYLKEVHLVNIDEATTSSLKKSFEKAVMRQFEGERLPAVTMTMVDDDAV